MTFSLENISCVELSVNLPTYIYIYIYIYICICICICIHIYACDGHTYPLNVHISIVFGPHAHKASVIRLQFIVFLPTCFALVHVFYPIFFLYNILPVFWG